LELARDWRTEPDGELGAPEPPPEVRAQPLSPARAAFARVFDITGSLVLLALASPLILLGAAMVRGSGGRPVFFGHVRVGRGGRLFRCWKLRTMHADAEARLRADAELRRRYVANGFKLPAAEDPRLLAGGRWLRRFYLDELPQLWNVLRGDMALIGPRPLVLEEIDLFGADAPELLAHRPGLFGEWTSRGRRRPPYPERVRVEMLWVHDPSLARGARIIARSVGAVLVGQGDGA
jgi:exopolysaccharide production protein ExoY